MNTNTFKRDKSYLTDKEIAELVIAHTLQGDTEKAVSYKAWTHNEAEYQRWHDCYTAVIQHWNLTHWKLRAALAGGDVGTEARLVALDEVLVDVFGDTFIEHYAVRKLSDAKEIASTVPADRVYAARTLAQYFQVLDTQPAMRII